MPPLEQPPSLPANHKPGDPFPAFVEASRRQFPLALTRLIDTTGLANDFKVMPGNCLSLVNQYGTAELWDDQAEIISDLNEVVGELRTYSRYWLAQPVVHGVDLNTHNPRRVMAWFSGGHPYGHLINSHIRTAKQEYSNIGHNEDTIETLYNLALEIAKAFQYIVGQKEALRLFTTNTQELQFEPTQTDSFLVTQ